MGHTFSSFLCFGFAFLITIQGQTEQEVLLQYKYVPGETYKIMIIETTESHLFDEKVPSPREALWGVPIIMRQAADGKILDMQPLEDVSSKKRKLIDVLKTQSQIGWGLPDRPLKRGEQWERSWAISYDLAERRLESLLKLSMKFVGFDNFRGTQCTVITENIEISGTTSTQFEEVPLKGKGMGEFLFDPVHGRLANYSRQCRRTQAQRRSTMI